MESLTAEQVSHQIDEFYRKEIEQIDRKIERDREKQIQVWIEAERDWKANYRGQNERQPL
jgi:hypothetical protein